MKLQWILTYAPRTASPRSVETGFAILCRAVALDSGKILEQERPISAMDGKGNKKESVWIHSNRRYYSILVEMRWQQRGHEIIILGIRQEFLRAWIILLSTTSPDTIIQSDIFLKLARLIYVALQLNRKIGSNTSHILILNLAELFSDPRNNCLISILPPIFRRLFFPQRILQRSKNFEMITLIARDTMGRGRNILGTACSKQLCKLLTSCKHFTNFETVINSERKEGWRGFLQ